MFFNLYLFKKKKEAKKKHFRKKLFNFLFNLIKIDVVFKSLNYDR
jgi:hypothetical protein